MAWFSWDRQAKWTEHNVDRFHSDISLSSVTHNKLFLFIFPALGVELKTTHRC